MTRPDPTADVCVFTATSERFVPGTLVTLGTFLRHHPEFAGDLVVVQDGLPAASRDVLRAAFARVRFQDVSPELGDRLARLNAVHHRFRGRTASLYYLDAFRLRGYRKVLCCDSDLLFQAPIGELFDATDALICCGDREFLAGRARDTATYLPTSLPGGASRGGTRTVLTRTFNCGFLVVDACLTGPSVHADLLDMVAPETWRASRVSLTDQLLLNRYFAGRQTLVSWTYNYLLPEAAAIHAREGLDPARAKVLHYKAPLKPWMTGDMLQWAMEHPPEHTAPAFTRWYDAYRDCLAGAYLRNARKGLAGIESFRGGTPRT